MPSLSQMAAFVLFLLIPLHGFSADEGLNPAQLIPAELLAEEGAKVARRVKAKLPTKCPETKAEWTQWRDQVADAIQGAARDGKDLGPAIEPAELLLNRCLKESKTSAAKEVTECLAPLKTFIQTYRNFNLISQDGEWRMLGFKLSDAQYYKATSQFTEIPTELKNDKFIRSLNKRETLTEAEAYLSRLNTDRKKQKQEPLQFAIYQSTVSAPDSGNYDRLIIFYPGSPERWVQFALPDKSGSKPSGVTSVLAVKKNAHGHDTYYKDHWRTFHPDGSVRFPTMERAAVGGGCVECHKSGPLPFGLEQKDPKVVGTLKAMNKRILDYGVTGTGGHFKTPEEMPSLGPDTDRDLKWVEFCIKQNFGDASSQDLQVAAKKIAGLMNCAQCHDGKQRGRLIPPFERTFGQIQDGKMPLHVKLSQPERFALIACLKSEFFGYSIDNVDHKGSLEAYLTSGDCEKSSNLSKAKASPRALKNH